MKILQHIFRFFICAAIGMTAAACLSDDYMFPDQPSVSEDIEYMTMTMQSDKLLPHQVTTRASDPKTEAEKAINHMHVLYFNSVTGKLLTPYVDQKTGKERFFPYVETDLTVIKIDKHAMLEANVQTSTNNDNSLPENLVIYVCVLANMESIIDAVDTEGYPVIGGERVTLNKLEQVLYKHPSASSDGNAILALPKDGMPMVGQKAFTLEENNMSNNLTVELTALMARVDFSIKIDAPIYEENLPKLTMQKWSVHNLPTSVSLGYDPDATTDLSQKGKTSASVVNNQIVYNKNGTVSFSFYMFENLQGTYKGGNDVILKDGNKISSLWVNALKEKYPDANWDTELKFMTISDIQKYKPLLAGDNATYVTLTSTFTTHDGKSYDVDYNLYLGANHTYDYNIRRNYQYKNDITIRGLVHNNDNVDLIGKYTFDARVNISESNGYFISILNEREHDAHFCVTPMDVYLFNGGSLTVSLDNTSLDDGGNPWVRMEHVPSSYMAAGTAVNANCIASNKSYHAGNSIRKYFTSDLVTNTLKANTSLTCDDRDRVYFYIDENLSTTLTREATVTLTYTDKNDVVSSSTLTLTQVPLLEVGLSNGTTIYMEQFEEYLDHYDPLNEYSTDKLYVGLPWGMKGTTIGDVGSTEIQNNYFDGLNVTNHIVSLDGTKSAVSGRKDNQLYITDTPTTAAGYCYSKNKWNTAGTAAIQKWFLPGITQMEETLVLYYNKYLEFQSNFYWSSSSGKRRESYLIFLYRYPEDNGYGRAVINKNGMQAASDWGDTNDTADINKIISTDNGQRVAGKIPRDKHLRIRAFRTDLN